MYHRTYIKEISDLKPVIEDNGLMSCCFCCAKLTARGKERGRAGENEAGVAEEGWGKERSFMKLQRAQDKTVERGG